MIPATTRTDTESPAEADQNDRLERGFVLVLPGIEGHSWFNRSIVRGLVDAGIDSAIEIHDWTAGGLLMLHNLRSRRRHADQTRRLVEKVLKYQDAYPGRPVHLIGHSGGGAMVLKTLQALPAKAKVTAGILLGAGVSPWFPLADAMPHVDRGIWNVRSWGDFFILGILTTIFGSLDGPHGPAAGCCGFSRTVTDPFEKSGPGAPRLVDVPFRTAMVRSGNFGGHFGCVNRRFVRDWIAPIVKEAT